MNEDRNMTISTDATETVGNEYRSFYGWSGMAAPSVSTSEIFNNPKWNEWTERYL